MEQVQRALVNYASRTKHREHDLETQPALEHMLQKMLASSSDLISWKSLYPLVSGDLARVTVRVGDQPLNDFCSTFTLPPELFSDLLVRGGIQWIHPELKRPNHTLERFIKEVAPPTFPSIDQDLSNQLYFLAANQRLKHNFRDILTALGTPKEEMQKLYNRIIEFKIDENDPEVARDIADAITGLEIPDLPFVFLKEEEEEEEKEEEEKEEELEMPESEGKEWTDETEVDYRNNPVMLEYKKANSLSRQFPVEKALYQILSAELATPVEKQYLGKRQTEINLVDLDEAGWEKILQVVDYANKEELEKAVKNSKQVADLCKLSEMVPSIRQAAKLVFTIYRNNRIGAALPKRIASYVKRHPQVDANLIKAVMTR